MVTLSLPRPFVLALLLATLGCKPVLLNPKSDLSSVFNPLAPVITWNSTQSTPTALTTAQFDFTVTDPSGVASVECRLDGGPYSTCVSPLNLTGITEGAHTLTLRATDPEGNFVIDSKVWVSDQSIPTVTLGTTPALQTVSTTASFSFTGADSVTSVASFECKLDGAAFAPCTSPSAQSALTEGSHTFSVRAIDAVAHVSSPATYTWTVDTSAPAINWILSQATPTALTTAHYEFSASDLYTGVASLSCKLDSGSFTTCTSPLDLTSITEGTHTLTVRAIDGVGNVGTDSKTWVSDQSVPTVTISAKPPLLDIEPRPSFSFTGLDTITSVAGYECKLDTGAFGVCTNPWVAPTLANGSHTFSVRATDQVGLVGAAASYTWTIDNTPPSAFTIAGVTGGTDATVDGLLTGGGLNPDVHWADSTGEDSFEVTIYESNGSTVRCSTEMTASNVLHFDFASCSLDPLMQYKVRVIAKDLVGNQTEASNSPFTFAVSSASPSILQFNGPTSVSQSTCTPINIESRSSTGLPASVASATTVTLAVNNGTGAFYPTSACSGAITSTILALNTYAQTVYFRSTTAPENSTLIATASGLTPASSPMTVGGSPIRLVLVGAPELKTNTCSLYTILLVDSLGARVSSTTAKVIDLQTSGTARFYMSSDCSGASTLTATIQPYSDSVTLYVNDAVAETITIQISDPAVVLASDSKSVPVVSTLTWWNPAWTRRLRIDVNNLDQAVALPNQPILIQLDSSKIDYSQARGQGQDIRVVASDQTTLLAHEIEVWNPSGASSIWVKLPSLSASSITGHVFVYYGNGSAGDTQDLATLWSDLWAAWHLSENAASTAPQFLDSTLTGKNGTAENAPVSVNAVIGGGLGVSGNDDVYDVGVDMAPVIGRTSTFSCWMRTNQLGNNTSWLAPGITGVEHFGDGNDIFFGWIDATGRIGVTAGNGSAAKSNFVVNDNAWRHVSITRNESTGAVQFFVNGVLNGTGTSETGFKSWPFQKIGIIGDSNGTPEDFNGTLDEVRIYSSVQTNARIRADYKYMTSSYLFYATPETP